MSVVTDIILTTPIDGASLLPKINAFFAAKHGDAVLYQVDKPKGAPGKAIQADVFIGAFNYLDLDAFVSHLRTVPWDEAYNVRTECVRLFVNEEHDEDGFCEVPIWEP